MVWPSPAAGGDDPQRDSWGGYVQNAFDLALCRSAGCGRRAVRIQVFFADECALICVAIGGDSVESPAELKPHHDAIVVAAVWRAEFVKLFNLPGGFAIHFRVVAGNCCG